MKVSGPLVVAENMSGTKMYEAGIAPNRTKTVRSTNAKTLNPNGPKNLAPNLRLQGGLRHDVHCRWSEWARTAWWVRSSVSRVTPRVSRCTRPGKCGSPGRLKAFRGGTGHTMWQDTSGLTVGDPLVKTGLPLSLELGPGILDGIYAACQKTDGRPHFIFQILMVCILSMYVCACVQGWYPATTGANSANGAKRLRPARGRRAKPGSREAVGVHAREQCQGRVLSQLGQVLSEPTLGCVVLAESVQNVQVHSSAHRGGRPRHRR